MKKIYSVSLISLFAFVGFINYIFGDIKQYLSKKGDVKGFTSAKGQHRTKLTKTVFGYFPNWVSDDAYIDWEALSHLSYFGAVAKTDGTLFGGVPSSKLIGYAKDNNVKFLLTITNFNPAEIDVIMGNSTVRNRLIQSIIQRVKEYNLDGISMDLETPNPEQKENINIFLSDLKTELKTIDNKLELHIATWPIDWDPPNYDYDGMSDIVDGMFLMVYNYHYRGSQEAGPVATFESGNVWSNRDVKWTVDDYLNSKTSDRKDKIIMGFPYYGLDWPTVNAAIPSRATGDGLAVSYNDVRKMLENNTRRWDNASKNPYIIYVKDGVTHQVWYDDEESLAYKYQFVLDKNLQGVGIWALGYDSGYTDLWRNIRNYFSTPVADTNVDRKVDITDFELIEKDFNQSSDVDANKYGDINEDGVINSLDASFVLTQWGDYPLPDRLN